MMQYDLLTWTNALVAIDRIQTTHQIGVDRREENPRERKQLQQIPCNHSTEEKRIRKQENHTAHALAHTFMCIV